MSGTGPERKAPKRKSQSESKQSFRDREKAKKLALETEAQELMNQLAQLKLLRSQLAEQNGQLIEEQQLVRMVLSQGMAMLYPAKEIGSEQKELPESGPTSEDHQPEVDEFDIDKYFAI